MTSQDLEVFLSAAFIALVLLAWVVIALSMLTRRQKINGANARKCDRLKALARFDEGRKKMATKKKTPAVEPVQEPDSARPTYTEQAVRYATAPVPEKKNSISKKENQEMSKSETETTVDSKVETIEKTYKLFDFATLKFVDVPVTAEFTPAADYAEAMNRLQGQEDVILEALNNALREQAKAGMRTEALKKGLPKNIVLKYAASFRIMPQFANMVTKEKGQKGWTEEYGKQTDAVLEYMGSSEFMVNSIRKSAESASASEMESDATE